MEENTQTPVQQDTSGQQATGGAGNGAPAGYVEQARFNGLVRKVEELTLANRDLNTQLTQRASEIEQLKGQLAVKDTEKQVAVGERDTRLTQALQDLAAKESQLKDLAGTQLKLNVIKKLNRPELIKIIDRVPNIEDEEALTTVMKDFAGFADELVQQRERQLLAGVTPAGGPGSIGNSEPSSQEGWLDKINGLPLGSKERTKAFDDYGKWLETNHK